MFDESVLANESEVVKAMRSPGWDQFVHFYGYATPAKSMYVVFVPHLPKDIASIPCQKVAELNIPQYTHKAPLFIISGWSILPYDTAGSFKWPWSAILGDFHCGKSVSDRIITALAQAYLRERDKWVMAYNLPRVR